MATDLAQSATSQRHNRDATRLSSTAPNARLPGPHRRISPWTRPFSPATQLAALVRGGKIGALELLDHYIARTERLDTRINAVVVRDFERARTRAKPWTSS